MPGTNSRRSPMFALPMKRLGLTLALPPAMLFLSTALRAAEVKPAEVAAANSVTVQRAPENVAPGPMTAEDILKRFDKNGDGKLDEDEAADAHEAMMQDQLRRQSQRLANGKEAPLPPQMLERFDHNHDGKLDDAERAEMTKFLAEHGFAGPNVSREEILKRFDKNGDGQLDDEERAEMRKALQARGPGGPGPAQPIRQEIMRRFDRNHDGKIDDAEWAELSPQLHERFDTTLRQLHRYDKNGDGVIDDTEWSDATADVRRWLNEAPPAPGREERVGPKAPHKKAESGEAPNPAPAAK
jgi:Ca2+-binding EF-hand superfamily protein